MPAESIGGPFPSALSIESPAIGLAPTMLRSPDTSKAGGRAIARAKSRELAPAPGTFDDLRLWAEIFHDNQKNRIATANRIRSGQVRKEETEALMGHLDGAETLLGLAMRRALRKAAPWASAWAKATHGIGEHTVARLLGAIGHPVIAYPMRWVTGPAPEGHVCAKGRCGTVKGKDDGQERHLVAYPSFHRTVSQLWSYCGHGDPTRRRRKGATQEEAMASGSPDAKMIVHLMAECCMKAGGPYRDVYDVARLQYADRIEADGKHKGKPWSDGHQHNAALRKVGKEILRDLWIAAQKELNEETTRDQGAREAHDTAVPAVSSPTTRKRTGGQKCPGAPSTRAPGSASLL